MNAIVVSSPKRGVKSAINVITLLLASILVVSCCSRKSLNMTITVPVNSETKLVDFTGTETVDSTSQLELYSRSREWFARSFVSSKAVLEMDDKEAGKLIGKAFSKMITVGGNTEMHFLVSVYVKDNKYKYSFSNISYEVDQYDSRTKTTKRVTFLAEDLITPSAVNCDCMCMVARARTKFRDETIEIMNKTIQSLNDAMNKENDF